MRVVGDEYVDEVVGEAEESAEERFPGAKYVSVYSHKDKEMVLVPIEKALTPAFGHAIDYASGVFEGGSVIINERTGIPNIVLLEPRNRRLFDRSLPSRDFQSPISEEELTWAMKQLVIANGENLFRDPDGVTPGWVRAYIRPSIHPKQLEGMGISKRDDYPIDVGILTWAWPDYLDPKMSSRGGVVAVTGKQRMEPITGKNASNYGEAGVDSKKARWLGTDEQAYLAPYLMTKAGVPFQEYPADKWAKMAEGVMADCSGEEIAAISADHKYLVYTPMRTNRLGGTVLQYLIDGMAEKVGLIPIERDITLNDLRAGKYAGLAMIGNAVEIKPVRAVYLFDENRLAEAIELFKAYEVPEKLNVLRLRWEDETRGRIKPTFPWLLTPVSEVWDSSYAHESYGRTR